jgi:hypothetical protein
MRTTTIVLCAAILALFAVAAMAQSGEDYGSWPLHRPSFESTGGGGYIIGDYNPVVAGGRCTTDFTVRGPDGSLGRNTVEFDAIETQGGVLCTNGRWRSIDGAGLSGTTPYRVFIRDGVIRGSAG